MAGDATFCKSCKAIFNLHSKLIDPTEEEKKSQELEDEKVWICEFCCTRNIVNLMDEEIPKKEAVNYILENAKAEENKKKSEEELAIVFCVDISGSMGVTKPMAGKFKIKGDRLSELQELMKFSDGSDQFAFKD